MADIILINDQDQEEVLLGVAKLITRGPAGDVTFSVDEGDNVTVNDFIERSLTGEYRNSIVATVARYGFSGFENPITIDLPNVMRIRDYGFYGCTGATSINLPKLVNAGQWSFSTCTNLTTINFPKLVKLENNMLTHCSKLTKVVAPSITTIGHTVFSGSPNVDTLVLGGNTLCSLAATDAFNDTKILKSTTEGFIYVPDSLVSQYKTSENWVDLRDKIKPLSQLPSE